MCLSDCETCVSNREERGVTCIFTLLYLIDSGFPLCVNTGFPSSGNSQGNSSELLGPAHHIDELHMSIDL